MDCLSESAHRVGAKLRGSPDYRVLERVSVPMGLPPLDICQEALE